MKKRMLALALTLALCLGLCVPVMAYEVPDFSDVPTDHWAYAPIMEMAEKGILKGVGDGQFDPEGQLTGEMFVVLIGRIVFPDVVESDEDWSGRYIATASGRGFFEKTSFASLEQLKGEITRYDMAEILAHAVGYAKVDLKYGFTPKVLKDEREAAVELQINLSGAEKALKDYESAPYAHKEAMRTVYAAGLMTGDGNGNFNGERTVTRMEAAVVIQRFLAFQDRVAQAMQLIAQRLQQELEDAAGQQRVAHMSREELEELLFQMDEDSFNQLSGGGYLSNYKGELQSMVLKNLGMTVKSFDAAYQPAAARRKNLAAVREKLKGLTRENLTSVDPFELRHQLSWLGELEEDALVDLMRDLGVTSADLDKAYHELDEAAAGRTLWNERDYTYTAAGELAAAAAYMAKAEGQESYTIRAHGTVISLDVVGDYFKPFPLSVYGEDGRMISEITVYSNGRGWELDMTLDTNHLDEVFTLKLEKPFESSWYRLLPEEADEASGGLKALVRGLNFPLHGGRVVY